MDREHEKRAHSQPRNGKPFEKKSFGKKPFDKKDRPAGGKPYGEKTYEKKDRPFGEKKPYEKKDRPFGEKKPYEKKDRPFGEKKPFEKKDRPFGEKPFEKKDRPFGERSFEKKARPFGEKPYGKKDRAFDRGDRPFEKRPPRDHRGRDDAFRPFAERPEAEGSIPADPARAEVRRPAHLSAGMDARRVALNALSDVNRADAYAALALDKRLREARLSPEDRRLATSIFYAAVENRLNIEYVLQNFMKTEPEPIVEDILHVACAQILFLDRIPAHAAVDEAVKQTRVFGKDEAAGFVNAVLRSLLRAMEADEIRYPDTEAEPVRYLSVKYSVPERVIERLIADYGFALAAEIVSFRPAERLETVRPNLMRMDESAFEAYMTNRGWSWRRGTVPGAYLVERAGNLAADPDFYDGVFSVQGESSMLAARAAEPKPGMTVLDACAAPGGKSALMCEMMRGTGRVHAWDVHEHRVELLKAMGKRLRLDNLRTAARDASEFREELEGQMDAVLVDAPCSGLGVMTDKPDLKYRVTDESVASLVETQKRILETCSRYVRAGGLLVYSTCSILPEENEKQVRAFLLNHPEFKADLDDRWLPDALKARFENGMLTLLPSRDGVEGFFIARMRRVDL